jgi:hypothetical protein
MEVRRRLDLETLGHELRLPEPPLCVTRGLDLKV